MYKSIGSFSPKHLKIVQLVQALTKINGKPISLSYYEKISVHLPYPTHEEIRELFGSWTNLLHIAGIIDIKKESSDYLNKLNYHKKMHYMKNKLSASQSLKFYKQCNETSVTIKQYETFRKEHPEMCSAANIIHHYGTWRDALHTHDLKTSRRFTKKECLSHLRAAQQELQDNFSSTKYSHWAKEHDGPSLTTVLNHFHTWKNIRKELR